MDTQTIVDLAVKGVTVLLMIVAASMAIKKRNNLALVFIIVGNLVAYYFTQSPLLCLIVSIIGIVWAGMSKKNEQGIVKTKSQPSKQALKSSAAIESKESGKRMVKPGPIIGLIIGIGLVVFPMIGFFMGEASLSDPQGKMIGFGFMIFGAIMVIINIIALVKGTDNIFASETAAPSTVTTVVKSSSRARAEDEDNGGKIRCRFCKKLYSSDYNGCPYCKKK